MKKILILFFALALLPVSPETALAQKKSAPRKKSVVKPKRTPQSSKQTPAADAESVFQTKLGETLAEPENWKEYSFAGENFKVFFPRSPVKNEEQIYEEALGKIKIIYQFSLGDSAMFAAASFPMSYSITDEAVLKDFYEEVAKEFLSDKEWAIGETKNIFVNNNSGLEISAENKLNKLEKARLRAFLIKNRVYLQMVIPMSAEDSGANDIENQAKLERETKMFFDSFADLPKTAAPPPAASVSPLFKSTFADGIYKSHYFNFTVKVPQGWLQTAQDDVAGMRERGRDVLEANTDGKLGGGSGERRNLFVFTSKPLGAPKNAMLSCNLTKRPSPSAAVADLSQITEETIKTVKLYSVVKPTHELTLGKMKFVGFLLKANIGGEEFEQGMYFLMRKDYALGFTFIYHDPEQKKLVLDALGSLTFEAE